MTSTAVYKGELRTQLKHERSGDVVVTDAPVDNNGKGEAFSPTDLMAASLGSCILTVMGIKCRNMEYNMLGDKCDIVKVMASDPRRVSEIHVHIEMPAGSSKKDRMILEHTALTCPVAQSIHPDIRVNLQFNWL